MCAGGGGNGANRTTSSELKKFVEQGIQSKHIYVIIRDIFH